MRCIYTEKVCSWEVVGPMGGEWLKEVDTSSVRWRGGKGYTRVAAVESFLIHLPMRMEPTESSETSVINVTWTQGTYPNDNKLL